MFFLVKMEMNMRKGWTDYVRAVRKKGNRGKKTMTHREAMKSASVSWPKEKAKLVRRMKRQCKKQSREEPQEQKTEVFATGSAPK